MIIGIFTHLSLDSNSPFILTLCPSETFSNFLLKGEAHLLVGFLLLGYVKILI